MRQSQNIVGSRIQALRQKQGLTQAMLSARLGNVGWHIYENTITKIETGVRCVTDRELILFAEALRVKLCDIFPDKPKLF